MKGRLFFFVIRNLFASKVTGNELRWNKEIILKSCKHMQITGGNSISIKTFSLRNERVI